MNSITENEKYFYTFKTVNSTTRTGGNFGKGNFQMRESNAYTHSNNIRNNDIVDYDGSLINSNRDRTSDTNALKKVKKIFIDEREEEINKDKEKDNDIILKPFRSLKKHPEDQTKDTNDKNIKISLGDTISTKNNLIRKNSRYENLDLNHNFIIEKNKSKINGNVLNINNSNYKDVNYNSYANSNFNTYNSNKILSRKSSILSRLKIRSDEKILNNPNSNIQYNSIANTKINTNTNTLMSRNSNTNANTQQVKEITKTSSLGSDP
jgi:hypothetical protein